MPTLLLSVCRESHLFPEMIRSSCVRIPSDGLHEMDWPPYMRTLALRLPPRWTLPPARCAAGRLALCHFSDMPGPFCLRAFSPALCSSLVLFLQIFLDSSFLITRHVLNKFFLTTLLSTSLAQFSFFVYKSLSEMYSLVICLLSVFCRRMWAPYQWGN